MLILIYLYFYKFICLYILIYSIFIYWYIYIFKIVVYLYVYIFLLFIYIIIDGSLEVQTSDNMDKWKSRGGKSQRREEKRISEKRKSQRKENIGARTGRKVAIHWVFSMICGSGGSKSRLPKAAGAEPAGQMRDEKLHAVVARSTFASEKAKNISRSDHFWKLTCPKSARRCGAKPISQV